MKPLPILFALLALVCVFRPSSLLAADPQGAAFAADVQITPELRSDILRLMKASGSSDMGTIVGTEVARQILAAYQHKHPEADPRIIEIIDEELSSFLKSEFGNSGPLSDMMIQLFARYYTQEDIKGLIAFHESPLGRKNARVMPQLTREGIALGQQYGPILAQKMAECVANRLRAEGFALQ